MYFWPNFETDDVDLIDGSMILTLVTSAIFKILSDIEDTFVECKKLDPLMKIQRFK